MSGAIGDRGFAYDDCPSCGTENEPFNVHGAPATAQQDWATYVCGGAGKGSANDGCGRNWSVTTKRGLEHNTAVGTQTLGKLTPALASGRAYFDTTPAYRRNYDLAFGKGPFEGLDEADRLALWRELSQN